MNRAVLTSMVAVVGLAAMFCAASPADLPMYWEAEEFERSRLAGTFKGLQSPDPLTREGCTHAVAAYGGERGLRALCAMLTDEVPQVRTAVADNLLELTEWQSTHETMREPLLRAVADEQDLYALSSVVAALGEVARASPDRAEIAEALAERVDAGASADVLWVILRALADLGTDASAALPRIEEVSRSPVTAVRLQAHAAFVAISGESNGHLEAIERVLLGGEDLGEKALAAEVSTWIGPAADPLVPALVSVLKEGAFWDPARALGAIGRGGVEGIAELESVARDASRLWGIRWFAVRTMGELHRDRGLVLPVLLELIQDEDFPHRDAAAFALGILGDSSSEVVEALVRAAEDDSPELRAMAVGSLGELGVWPEEAWSVLVARAGDDSRQVRREAIGALGLHPGHTEEWVSILSGMLWSEDEDTVKEIIEVLEKIGPAAADAVPDLRLLRKVYQERWKLGRPFANVDWLEIVRRVEHALEAIEPRSH